MNDELIEKFIASKSGMCETSKAIYRYYLKKAFNTIGKGVNDITADDLRHYIFEMDKSYDVIHRERSVLGGFFSYLYKNGAVRINPVDGMKVPKSKKPEKKKNQSLRARVLRIIRTVKNVCTETMFVRGRVGERVTITLSPVNLGA